MFSSFFLPIWFTNNLCIKTIVNTSKTNGCQHLSTDKVLLVAMRLLQGTNTTISMFSPSKISYKVHTSYIPKQKYSSWSQVFHTVLEFHKRTYPVTASIIHSLMNTSRPNYSSTINHQFYLQIHYYWL